MASPSMFPGHLDHRQLEMKTPRLYHRPVDLETVGTGHRSFIFWSPTEAIRG